MSSREANLWGISLLVIIALQWVVLIGLVRRMLRQGQDVEDLKVLANQAQDRRMKRILTDSQSPTSRSTGGRSLSPSGLAPRGYTDTNHLYRSSSQGRSPSLGPGGSGPELSGTNNFDFVHSPLTLMQSAGGSPSMLGGAGVTSPAGLRPKTGLELAAISAQRRSRTRNPLPPNSPNPNQQQMHNHAEGNQGSQQQQHFTEEGEAPTENEYKDRHQRPHIGDVDGRTTAERQTLVDRLTALETTQEDMSGGQQQPVSGNANSALTLSRNSRRHSQDHDMSSGSLALGSPDYRVRSKAAMQASNRSEGGGSFQLSPKPEIVGHPSSLLHTSLPPLGQRELHIRQMREQQQAVIPIADIPRNSTATYAGNMVAPIELRGVPNATMVCLLVTAPEWVDPITVAPVSLIPHLLEVDPSTKEGGSLTLTQISDVHAAVDLGVAAQSGPVTASLPVKQLGALVVYPAGPEPKLGDDTTVWFPLRLDPTDGQMERWWEDDGDSQASGSPSGGHPAHTGTVHQEGGSGVVVYFLTEGERGAWSKWLQVGNMIPSLPCDVEYPEVPVPPMRNASKEATILSPESRKHSVVALGFSPDESGVRGVRRSSSRTSATEAPQPPPKQNYGDLVTPNNMRSPLTERRHNIAFDPHAKVVQAMSPPRYNNGPPAQRYAVQVPPSPVEQHQYPGNFEEEEQDDLNYFPQTTQHQSRRSVSHQRGHSSVAIQEENYSAWGQPAEEREYREAPAPFDGFRVTSTVTASPGHHSAYPTTLTGFDEVDDDEAAQYRSQWDGRVSIPTQRSLTPGE